MDCRKRRRQVLPKGHKWLQVITELNNRGVNDILIACVDGLKGFPEAIETVFPKAAVQLCIVHLVRNSLNYVSYKKRQAVADGLKRIYQSPTAQEAEQRLTEFEDKAGRLSHHRPDLAAKLGSNHPVLRLSARDSQSDLHYQHHRISQSQPEKNHQKPLGLSQ